MGKVTVEHLDLIESNGAGEFVFTFTPDNLGNIYHVERRPDGSTRFYATKQNEAAQITLYDSGNIGDTKGIKRQRKALREEAQARSLIRYELNQWRELALDEVASRINRFVQERVDRQRIEYREREVAEEAWNMRQAICAFLGEWERWGAIYPEAMGRRVGELRDVVTGPSTITTDEEPKYWGTSAPAQEADND